MDTTDGRRKQGWQRETLEPALARAPERDTPFETTWGEPTDALYTPEDWPEEGYLEKLGFPGEYPFTRGIQPTMYRGRLWTMRQYAGFGDAQETNARFRYLLEHGQTGLSVAFDLPTQIGYDPDHPMALSEVGKVGVSIASLEDMEALLAGIPLEQVTSSMTINATAAILLALYVAVARGQGADLGKIGGTVQNDILKEYIARGTYIFPPGPSIRLVTDVFAYCRQRVPQWNTISISGYHLREAGCTAPQEVGFTLANAIAYVEAALRAGLEVDEFAPRLSFFFACHSNFLEEVAKFRAARRLWASIMRERFKARDPRSMMLRFHTQTGGATLTAQQPHNNVVRTAFQALAAVLGGTQSLHTNAMDEALALPSEKAALLALRTQQIIAYETGVTDTVDPLGGSWYVEHLTDRVEEEARRYIDRIEDLGGAVAAIERGFQQREIHETAYRHQKEVEAGRRIVVGVNKFQTEEEAPVPVLRLDPALGRRRVEEVQALRRRRDARVAKRTRQRIEEAARSEENLVPLFIGAVENSVTLGEICDTLRGVWGEQRESVVI